MNATSGQLCAALGALLSNRAPVPTVSSVPPPSCNASVSAALFSNCPSSAWHDAIATQLRRKRMWMINIGANKGYNIHDFMLRYGPGYTATTRAWHQGWGALFSKDSCGACGACLTQTSSTQTSGSRSKAESVYIIAVELGTTTCGVLQDQFARFAIPGVALHAAAGGRVKDAHEHPRSSLGREKVGVAKSGRLITMLTVDSLFSMLPALPPASEPVDFLSIDTEGQDPDVLLGACRALERRRFRLLEFEHHRFGLWKTVDINRLLKLLRLAGYVCFWQGNFGKLAPVRRGCDYNLHRWSNVLCAHEPELLRPMWKLTEDVDKQKFVTRNGFDYNRWQQTQMLRDHK